MAVAVFDRLPSGLPPSFAIPAHTWKRREIENYLTTHAVLERYAIGMEPDDLVTLALREKRRDAMNEAIGKVEAALQVLGRDPWSDDFKVSDEFLPPVFTRYFENLSADDRLAKSDFYVLTDHVAKNEIDPEIVSVLDLIAVQDARAKPSCSA